MAIPGPCLRRAILLEKVLTHIPFAPVPMQASYTPLCGLLTWVEVFTALLAGAPVSLGTHWEPGKSRRTSRTWWLPVRSMWHRHSFPA